MSYHPARRVLAVAGKNTYLIAVSDEHYLSDDEDDDDAATTSGLVGTTRRRRFGNRGDERRHLTKTAGLQKVSGVGSRSTLVDWSATGALAVADPKGLSVYDCVTNDRVANSTLGPNNNNTTNAAALTTPPTPLVVAPPGTRGVSQKPPRNWIINSSISNQTPTSRAKSAIAWDPHNPHVLAHASLVCALELSDTRTPLHLGQGCAATVGAQGHDISFSSTKPFMVAVAADQSSGVLLFDQRKFSQPVVTIPTPATCTAVSFHPLYTDLLAYSYQPSRNQPNAIIAFHNVATIPSPATAAALPHSLLFGSGGGSNSNNGNGMVPSHVSDLPSGNASVSQYSSASVGGHHLQYPLWEVDTSKTSLYGPCIGLAPISCAWRQDRIRWRPTTNGGVTPSTTAAVSPTSRYHPSIIDRVSPLWFATCSQTFGTTPHIWDALHSSTPLLSGHNLHVERNEKGQVNVRDGGDVVWISPTTMISCGGRTVVSCNIGVDGGGVYDDEDMMEEDGDGGDRTNDCASTLWNQPASLQSATFSALGFGEYVMVRDPPEQRMKMQSTILDSIAVVASGGDVHQMFGGAAPGDGGAGTSGPLFAQNGSSLKVNARPLTESPQISAVAGGQELPALNLAAGGGGGGGASSSYGGSSVHSTQPSVASGSAAPKKSFFGRIFGNDNSKSSSKTRGPSASNSNVGSGVAIPTAGSSMPHSPPSTSLSAQSPSHTGGITPHSGSLLLGGAAGSVRTNGGATSSTQMSPHIAGVSTVGSAAGAPHGAAAAAAAATGGTFPLVTQLPPPCIGDDLHRLVQSFRVPVPAGMIETITIPPQQLPKFSNHVVRTTRKQFRRLGQHWESCYEAVVSLKTAAPSTAMTTDAVDDATAAVFAANHRASIAKAKLSPSDPRCCIWASLSEAFYLHEPNLMWGLITQALEYATQCGDVQLSTFLYITALVWWRQRVVMGEAGTSTTMQPPYGCVLLTREWRQRAFQFVSSYNIQLEAMEMWAEWSELEYTFPFLVALPVPPTPPPHAAAATATAAPAAPPQHTAAAPGGATTAPALSLPVIPPAPQQQQPFHQQQNGYLPQQQQRSQLLDGGDTTNPCFRVEVAQEKNREFLYCTGCQNLAVPAEQVLASPASNSNTSGAAGGPNNNVLASTHASSGVARCKNCRGRLLHVCVICEQPVEGLYVWLKPCGHGGHWNHLEEWMQENDECPKCGVLLVDTARTTTCD